MALEIVDLSIKHVNFKFSHRQTVKNDQCQPGTQSFHYGGASGDSVEMVDEDFVPTPPVGG